MMNFFIGALFVLLLFQLYRSMHGKGTGTGGKAGGTTKDSSSGGGGMFGGKGGMGDIFGMSKSNV